MRPTDPKHPNAIAAARARHAALTSKTYNSLACDPTDESPFSVAWHRAAGHAGWANRSLRRSELLGVGWVADRGVYSARVYANRHRRARIEQRLRRTRQALWSRDRSDHANWARWSEARSSV